MSNIKDIQYQRYPISKISNIKDIQYKGACLGQPISWIMATMLCDVPFYVGHMRLQSMLLAMSTMKACMVFYSYACMLFSSCGYGDPFDRNLGHKAIPHTPHTKLKLSILFFVFRVCFLEENNPTPFVRNTSK